jgi:hypothetical protein
MNAQTIPLPRISGPYQPLRIQWEVDGRYSGTTQVPAWAVQDAIDKLQAGGYTILDVVPA